MIKSSIKQNRQRQGYKFRLMVTNSDAKRQQNTIVGCCYFVLNKALALVKQDDKNYRTMLEMVKMNGGDVQGISSLFKFNSYHQLSALLTTWKQQTEKSFLEQVYSKSLQIVEELGQAVAEAKNKINPKLYPVFKKHGVKNSFSWEVLINCNKEASPSLISKNKLVLGLVI